MSPQILREILRSAPKGLLPLPKTIHLNNGVKIYPPIHMKDLWLVRYEPTEHREDQFLIGTACSEFRAYKLGKGFKK